MPETHMEDRRINRARKKKRKKRIRRIAGMILFLICVVVAVISIRNSMLDNTHFHLLQSLFQLILHY